MPLPRIAPLALLWLAACSQNGDDSEPPAPSPSVSPSVAEPAPAPSPATPAAVTGTIPAAYRGAWDWTGGSCAPESELRLEIGGERINFYESVGMVEAVRDESGALTIDLAMEGEGEIWRQTTVLRLIEGGRLLESALADPSGDGPLRYRRCPGEAPAR